MRLLPTSTGGRRAACVAYTVLVAVLSLMPDSALGDIPDLLPHLDKAAHFVIYAGMTLLWRWPLRRPHPVLLAALCTLYGVTLECLQGAFANGMRTFSAGDMAANAAGAAGAGAWLIMRARAGAPRPSGAGE